MDTTMNVDLKFLKSWGSYNNGEAARFAADVAEALIRKGIAVEYRADNSGQSETDAVKGPAASRPDDKTRPASK